MKIVKVEAFAIQAQPIDTRAYWGSRAWGTERAAGQAELSTEYPVPLRRRFVYSRTIDTVIVRIETDTGYVGWGECKAPVAARATATLVDELLTPLVVGSRLDEIAVTWERMYAAMRVRVPASRRHRVRVLGVVAPGACTPVHLPWYGPQHERLQPGDVHVRSSAASSASTSGP